MIKIAKSCESQDALKAPVDGDVSTTSSSDTGTEVALNPAFLDANAFYNTVVWCG